MTAPRDYAPDVGARACEMIRKGQGLPAIVRSGLFDLVTLGLWRSDVPDFRAAYARARRDQGDLLADEVVEIADGATDDDMALAKLRIDARKWRVAILREDFTTLPNETSAGNMVERLREAHARIAADAAAERAEAALAKGVGHG